jgi:hypothetical protein
MGRSGPPPAGGARPGQVTPHGPRGELGGHRPRRFGPWIVKHGEACCSMRVFCRDHDSEFEPGPGDALAATRNSGARETASRRKLFLMITSVRWDRWSGDDRSHSRGGLWGRSVFVLAEEAVRSWTRCSALVSRVPAGGGVCCVGGGIVERGGTFSAGPGPLRSSQKRTPRRLTRGRREEAGRISAHGT